MSDNSKLKTRRSLLALGEEMIGIRRLNIGSLTFCQFHQPLRVSLQPGNFLLHHHQKSEAFHPAEGAGSGDGKNRLGDQRFDHQPRQRADLRLGLLISVRCSVYASDS